ncbi:polysaccharide deacetylase family protein [Streptococcus ictaluri]|uniref:Polysaccharide deacetylase n=1 Tax=Streptococcus ictaluri 707-05 TaxID=764299 RepID=G5K3I0_9STRE|nr:polysaccharide deacetylase family protein [Streptococcus ictaluri]EHI69367.1 polysaccharide deacetylase [Streptococcus ictaluri 707-05]
MKERSKRRHKRKFFTILNSLLLLACAMGIGTIIFLYQGHRHFSLPNFSQNTLQTAFASKSSPKKTTKPKVTAEQKDITKKEESLQWAKQEQAVHIPILMYHAVHVMAPEEAASANLIVDPALFESQLKAMTEAGYYFLTPEEAYRALSQNELPAQKVVWLTFDDSMIDFYNVAFPLLKKYKAKATNNVITGLTEAASPANLTLEQMKEMKAFGMSFQDHTVNHPDLSQSSLDQQKAEMKDSKDYLDKSLQQETIAIAYPAGRYNDNTLTIAQELNYKLGVTTNEGLASAQDGLLSLNRLRILPTTTAEALLSAMSHQ